MSQVPTSSPVQRCQPHRGCQQQRRCRRHQCCCCCCHPCLCPCPCLLLLLLSPPQSTCLTWPGKQPHTLVRCSQHSPARHHSNKHPGSVCSSSLGVGVLWVCDTAIGGEPRLPLLAAAMFARLMKWRVSAALLLLLLCPVPAVPAAPALLKHASCTPHAACSCSTSLTLPLFSRVSRVSVARCW